MPDIGTWLPLVLGGLIVLAICFKVFTDKTTNNYIGYAMVAAVVLCALPSIQNFSYKGQLGEVSGAMKDAVARQSANIGGDVDSANKKLDAILKKLNATADVAAPAGYQSNKDKEVLVYYAATAAAQATRIRSFLLDSGYKSSATYTDFAEAMPPLPAAGSLRLVYTAAETNLANTIRADMRKKFPEIREIGDRVVDKMNSGQVQVQLF